MDITDMAARYLEPTQDSGKALLQRHIVGPVVMVNLLRFRAIADYSATPHLAPAEPMSGEAASKLYIEYTLPHLEKSRGSLVFLSNGGNFLIGPSHERRNLAMLVSQSSVADFLAFASNQEYLTEIGHRTAALENSRILPLIEGTVTELF